MAIKKIFNSIKRFKNRSPKIYHNWYIVIFGILTLISLVLNYIIPIKTSEKYGGSNYGKYGGFIGTIVGLFFPPLGFLIGMLLGVFLGELLHDRNDKQKALEARAKSIEKWKESADKESATQTKNIQKQKEALEKEKAILMHSKRLKAELPVLEKKHKNLS